MSLHPRLEALPAFPTAAPVDNADASAASSGITGARTRFQGAEPNADVGPVIERRPRRPKPARPAEEPARTPAGFPDAARIVVRESRTAERSERVRRGEVGAAKPRATDGKKKDENDKKIDAMSREEIERAQREIRERFDPDVLAALIAKSTRASDAAPSRLKSKPKAKESIQPDSSKQSLGWIRTEADLLEAAQRLSTPFERSKLSWMSAANEEEEESAQESSASSMKDPRFDLAGNFLSDEDSDRATSSSLFHHGEEPSRAGYTYAELVHLCRSQSPPQRLIALRALSAALYARQARVSQRSTAVTSRDRWSEETAAECLVSLRLALDDADATLPILGSAIDGLHALLVPVAQNLLRAEIRRSSLTINAVEWGPLEKAQGAGMFGRRACVNIFNSAPKKKRKTARGEGAEKKEEHEEEEEEDGEDLTTKGREGLIEECLERGPASCLRKTRTLARLAYLLTSSASLTVLGGLSGEAKVKALEIVMFMIQSSRRFALEEESFQHVLRVVEACVLTSHEEEEVFLASVELIHVLGVFSPSSLKVLSERDVLKRVLCLLDISSDRNHKTKMTSKKRRALLRLFAMVVGQGRELDNVLDFAVASLMVFVNEFALDVRVAAETWNLFTACLTSPIWPSKEGKREMRLFADLGPLAEKCCASDDEGLRTSALRYVAAYVEETHEEFPLALTQLVSKPRVADRATPPSWVQRAFSFTRWTTFDLQSGALGHLDAMLADLRLGFAGSALASASLLSATQLEIVDALSARLANEERATEEDFSNPLYGARVYYLDALFWTSLRILALSDPSARAVLLRRAFAFVAGGRAALGPSMSEAATLEGVHAIVCQVFDEEEDLRQVLTLDGFETLLMTNGSGKRESHLWCRRDYVRALFRRAGKAWPGLLLMTDHAAASADERDAAERVLASLDLVAALREDMGDVAVRSVLTAWMRTQLKSERVMEDERILARFARVWDEASGAAASEAEEESILAAVLGNPGQQELLAQEMCEAKQDVYFAHEGLLRVVGWLLTNRFAPRVRAGVWRALERRRGLTDEEWWRVYRPAEHCAWRTKKTEEEESAQREEFVETLVSSLTSLKLRTGDAAVLTPEHAWYRVAVENVAAYLKARPGGSSTGMIKKLVQHCPRVETVLDCLEQGSVSSPEAMRALLESMEGGRDSPVWKSLGL